MRYLCSSSQRQHQQHCEDVLLVGSSSEFARPFSVWAVFDGHNGDRVAQYLGSNLLPELERRLPAAQLPEDSEHEKYIYADHVRRAVLATFLQLSLDVQQQSLGSGCGSTAAVVVQTGQLLTVANVGSTRCVLDVGHTAFECTADHKLGSNEDEEERLDAAGACIARLKFDLSGPAAPGEVGCGPLRLWPGGLHMSRAIGDSDCGHLVIPHPYIQQVWLPRSKASRLIIATGNVWDSFDTYQKAASALRDVSLPNAAGAMLQRALKRKQHRVDKGDLSVMVVDFVPESCNGFSSQHRLDRLSRSSTCSTSSSQGISLPSPGSLFRRSATATRLPNLCMEGMQMPQQQQQQQCKLKGGVAGKGQLFGATPSGASCGAASASANGSPISSSLMHSPSLTPCSSGRGMEFHLEANAAQQQQQQQPEPRAGATGVLQRLLPQLCRGPVTQTVCSGIGSPQQQQQPSDKVDAMLFGSSCDSAGGTLNSSSGSSVDAPSSSSSSSMYSPRSSSSNSISAVGSWRSPSSWRSRTRSRKAAAAAQQLAAGQRRQQHLNPSFARVIAKVDTFQVFFKGQYMPIEKQLALLNTTCSWPTVRPARPCGNVDAGIWCDLAAQGSDSNPSAQQQAGVRCQ